MTNLCTIHPDDKLSEFNHKNYKRFSSKYDNDDKELLKQNIQRH